MGTPRIPESWTTTIAGARILAVDDGANHVVVATPFGAVTMLDAATGRRTDEFRIEPDADDEREGDRAEALSPGQRRLTHVDVATDGTLVAALTSMVTHAGDLHVQLFARSGGAIHELDIEPDCAVDHWDRPWALSPDGTLVAYVWAAEDDCLPRLHLRSLPSLATGKQLECGDDDEVECDAVAIDLERDLFAIAGEFRVFLWHRRELRSWKKPAPIDRVILSAAHDALWAVTEAERTVWIFDGHPVRGARLPARIEQARFISIDRDAKTARWLSSTGVLVEQRLTDGWIRELPATGDLVLGPADRVHACGSTALVTLRSEVVARVSLPDPWTAWAPAEGRSG